MMAVKNKELSSVVVYSFSRFARSTTHLLSALEEMKKYETEFISLTEKIETNSPMGRAAAAVARVSHGSIHAEKVAMLREEREKLVAKEQEEQPQAENPPVPNPTVAAT